MKFRVKKIKKWDAMNQMLEVRIYRIYTDQITLDVFQSSILQEGMKKALQTMRRQGDRLYFGKNFIREIASLI